MVVQLLGPDVCLTHNQFLTKLPDHDGTHSDIPMHQDNGYGRLEPPDDVTVWVALTDTNLRNGCLYVVPGLAPRRADRARDGRGRTRCCERRPPTATRCRSSSVRARPSPSRA